MSMPHSFRFTRAFVRISRTKNLLMASLVSLFFASPVHATIVQFQTVMGDFQVNLYDKATPKTVENFLAYVKSGAYTNAIIHRAERGFIVQGGGYQYAGKLPLNNIEQKPAVINEPVYSNRRGTIAMAKIGDNPNSATNQWFFNLTDNSKNLDYQNSGFTVFGEVMGNGIGIIESMAALSIFNMGSPFDSLPLRNYTSTDLTNKVPLSDKNFVMILAVVVLDANVDTAASLTPVKSLAITDPQSNNNGSSGGGAMNLLGLCLLITSIGILRRWR